MYVCLYVWIYVYMCVWCVCCVCVCCLCRYTVYECSETVAKNTDSIEYDNPINVRASVNAYHG